LLDRKNILICNSDNIELSLPIDILLFHQLNKFPLYYFNNSIVDIIIHNSNELNYKKINETMMHNFNKNINSNNIGINLSNPNTSNVRDAKCLQMLHFLQQLHQTNQLQQYNHSNQRNRFNQYNQINNNMSIFLDQKNVIDNIDVNNQYNHNTNISQCDSYILKIKGEKIDNKEILYINHFFNIFNNAPTSTFYGNLCINVPFLQIIKLNYNMVNDEQLNHINISYRLQISNPSANTGIIKYIIVSVIPKSIQIGVPQSTLSKTMIQSCITNIHLLLEQHSLNNNESLDVTKNKSITWNYDEIIKHENMYGISLCPEFSSITKIKQFFHNNDNGFYGHGINFNNIKSTSMIIDTNIDCINNFEIEIYAITMKIGNYNNKNIYPFDIIS
jgi:hypothetical protein